MSDAQDGHETERAIRGRADTLIRDRLRARERVEPYLIVTQMRERWAEARHDCANRPRTLPEHARWVEHRIDEVRHEQQPPVLAIPDDGLAEAARLAGRSIRWNRTARRVDIRKGDEGEWEPADGPPLALLVNDMSNVAVMRRNPASVHDGPVPHRVAVAVARSVDGGRGARSSGRRGLGGARRGSLP